MGNTGRRQARTAVALLLATGLTAKEAAARAGISENTIVRWRRDPAFVAEVDAARAEMVRQTIDRLTDAATRAVNVLLDLLAPTVPPRIRLGAAKAVLEVGLRYREVEDLAKRVAALEEAIAMRRD